MGKPLKAIPQITVEDKKASQVLDALKYVIDVREGRGTADQGKMWVTFDDLWDALKNLNPVADGVLSEEFVAFEDLEAGCFVSVFKDAEDGDKLKVRKACSLVDEAETFKICNGYVLKDYTSGATAVVYYNGINTAYSGFEELETGAIVYLASVAGGCSESSSRLYQMVGMVVKSGILFLPGNKEIDCCECPDYGDETACDGALVPSDTVIPDSTGLSDETTAKVFLRIDAALVFGRDVAPIDINSVFCRFSDEDPDCSSATYITAIRHLAM